MRRRLLIFAAVAAVLALAAWIAFGVLVSSGAADAPFIVLPFAIVLTVAAVLDLVFGLVFDRFGSAASYATPAQVAEAAASGRSGYARVLSATPTGAKLNNGWAYDADLVVLTTDRAAYRTRETVRVNRREGGLKGTNELITVVRVARDAPGIDVLAGPTATPQDVAVPFDAAAWA